MRDPLLLPCAAVAAGILLARSVGFSTNELAFAAVGFAALIAVALWRRLPRAARLGAWLLCLLAGIATQSAHQRVAAPTLDAGSGELVTLSGCVVDPPLFTADREQFDLALTPTARARVTLTLKEGQTTPPLRYGQQIELVSRVRQPHSFHNPGAFDYVAYLARQNVYWTATATPSGVQAMPGSCGTPVLAWLYTLRQSALQRLDALYPGDEYAAAMMQAILLGETRRLERLWTEDFRLTGTYHALVISGLHVSVLAGSILFLLRLAGVPQFPALLCTVCAAWLYVGVAGLSAPVLRAAGGFTFFLVARLWYRRQRVLNLLAATGMIVLLIDPGAIGDASFQLSFLSVAAIGGLVAPVVERRFRPLQLIAHALDDARRDPPLPRGICAARVELRLLAETLALGTRLPLRYCLKGFSWSIYAIRLAGEMVFLSAVIQIALAIPMITSFHRIPLTGLTANILVVPLLSALVPVGFAALFTGWHWVAQCALLLLRAASLVVAWHLKWEPHWRIPDPPPALALLLVLLLLATAISLHRRARWRYLSVLATMALFFLLVWHPFAPQLRAGALELTTVDVGQGDGLLVTFPNGSTMLVDGGGTPVFGKARKPKLDTGEDVIAPYLWSRSIKRLDVVVCTHLHEDHSGGLPAILADFHPRELWVGAMPEEAAWDKLQAVAAQQHVRVRALRAGTPWTFGGVQTTVLSPPADYEPGRNRNNDSLVLKLRHGAHTFLLTGDVERQMETRFDPGKIDVLKVAHHGSRTSTTDDFLALAKPSFALISAGPDNRYKLPHPEVLERLQCHHIMYWRTDRDGLVTIWSDGKRLHTQGAAEDESSGIAALATVFGSRASQAPNQP